MGKPNVQRKSTPHGRKLWQGLDEAGKDFGAGFESITGGFSPHHAQDPSATGPQWDKRGHMGYSLLSSSLPFTPCPQGIRVNKTATDVRLKKPLA